MKLNNFLFFLLTAIIASCSNPNSEKKDSARSETKQPDKKDTIKKDSTQVVHIKDSAVYAINDTLNSLAAFIAGSSDNRNPLFKDYYKQNAYINYSSQFSKRWENFDSTKLAPIKQFAKSELKEQIDVKNIFYPFSGPDILYSSSLFPDAINFTLIGLEPVGTLPVIEDKEIIADSIQNYVDKINTSLNAILKFSFFRTISMKEDLRNKDVDGTLHLLLLFLNKTGHRIISVKPFYIDTAGNKEYLNNFKTLKNKTANNKSAEFKVLDAAGRLKIITYTSADLSDAGFYKNKGLVKFIENLGFETTYLKGASYLMHKKNFNRIRKLILNNTNQIVQDDSGIGISYILNDINKWSFSFYGEYIKPINMFTQHYQPELDSLYHVYKPKKLGFGLGYNYRDKNSNFMIIKKKKN